MSTNEANRILTPVGRLVGGSPFEGKKTDFEGNPLTVKSGPNQGDARTEFYMAIAIPKTSAEWPALWAQLHAAAVGGFPTLFDPQGTCLAPQFAYKYTDGDSVTPNLKGNKPCDREGYPGHHVLHFSNGYAPKCYNAENPPAPLVDTASIKRGYFVRIAGDVKANGKLAQPGLFLNGNMVQLIAFGEEIISGPDAATVFAPAAGALPVGASATPIAGATPPPAGPGPQTPPPGAPPAGPPAGVTPAPGFVDNAAGATPPPPAAPPTMTPPAEAPRLYNNGVHLPSALRAQGWTEAQITALPLAPDGVPY